MVISLRNCSNFIFRAGILFVNPADLGWNPPVSSWLDSREVQSERANLTILFDKYVPPILEALKTRWMKLQHYTIIQGVPIKTPNFDFITIALFFSKCNFIIYECEAKMSILTNLSLILSGYCQICGNRLDCEIAFLRMWQFWMLF